MEPEFRHDVPGLGRIITPPMMEVVSRPIRVQRPKPLPAMVTVPESLDSGQEPRLTPHLPMVQSEIIIPPAGQYFGANQMPYVLDNDEKVQGLYVSESGVFYNLIGLGRDMVSHFCKHRSLSYDINIAKTDLSGVPDFVSVPFHFYVLDVAPAYLQDVIDVIRTGASPEKRAAVSIVSKDQSLVQRVAELYQQEHLTFVKGDRHGDIIDPNLSGYFRKKE